MKEAIIKQFLLKGKLLTPEALSMIDDGIVVETDHLGSLVITVMDLEEAMKPREYSVVKNLTQKKTELGTGDFARFYKSKYEKLRDIITGRIKKNFISLNKIDDYRSEIYVIGIVKDIRENEGKVTVELEDPTATVPVIFEKSELADVELDDVVAVKAVSSKNVLFGKQIIFPDVPLRPPTTVMGKACFVANLNLHEAPKDDVEAFFSWISQQDITYIFVAGNIGDLTEFENYTEKYCNNKIIFICPGEHDVTEGYPQLPLQATKKNIISLSNPSMVDINGMKILLSHNFGVGMLKKRYLGKSKTILDEDYLVMDEVPDVVCFGHSPDPQILNYKSITIVSSGSIMSDFHPIVMDFSTRDTTKIQLQK